MAAARFIRQTDQSAGLWSPDVMRLMTSPATERGAEPTASSELRSEFAGVQTDRQNPRTGSRDRPGGTVMAHMCREWRTAAVAARQTDSEFIEAALAEESEGLTLHQLCSAAVSHLLFSWTPNVTRIV